MRATEWTRAWRYPRARWASALVPFFFAVLLLGAASLGRAFAAGPNLPPPADPAIAFSKAASASVNKLMVMNVNGSNQATVFTSSALFSAPSWSPDGQSLAFSIGTATQLWRVDVVVVNGVPQGQNPLMLAAFDGTCSTRDPAWSPVGNVIAYATFCSDPYPSLVAIPATGGTPTPLYTAPAGHYVVTPSWNWDASKIAFVEMDSAGLDSIRVLELGSGIVTTVLGPGPFINSIDWARQNVDQVAFSSGGAVKILDLPTGVVTTVTTGRYPTWSPDNTKLAFDNKGKVRTITLSTGATSVLAGGQKPDWRRF